jgi:excisionase family DNA binding protein
MESRPLYEDRVYTVDEVAAILRVPATTVRRLIRKQELPAIRLGRTYRVPKSAIDRLFAVPILGFSPEELGFGMWADDAEIGDSVEYVNRLRESDGRTLREVLEDLNSWPD